ncbi:MAG: hypothetical protein KDC66_03335 [Phaeodactylibacter sp.]|nr:hypothetical protein [Phaeodactylibacter sp.]
MKPILLLLLAAMLALGSCAGKKNGKGLSDPGMTASDTMATEDTAVLPAAAEDTPTAEALPEQTAPFEQKLTAGKISFTLSCSNEQPQKNELCATPEGLEVRNERLCFEVDGRVSDAFQGDLNGDGFIEIYAASSGPAPEARGHLYGFASYRNRSYGIIAVREPKGDMMQGYEGRDTFYMMAGKHLMRAFPVYSDGGQPTGQRRVITYVLKQGETSFVLEPSSSETR